jgi:hypothetical protein
MENRSWRMGCKLNYWLRGGIAVKLGEIIKRLALTEIPDRRMRDPVESSESSGFIFLPIVDVSGCATIHGKLNSDRLLA